MRWAIFIGPPMGAVSQCKEKGRDGREILEIVYGCCWIHNSNIVITWYNHREREREREREIERESKINILPTLFYGQ